MYAHGTKLRLTLKNQMDSLMADWKWVMSQYVQIAHSKVLPRSIIPVHLS